MNSLKRPIQFLWYLLIPLLFSLLVESCNPKIASVNLPYDTLFQFAQSGDAQIQNEWWKAFEDEDLNRLIDSALKRNLPLAASWSQLQAAHSVLKQSKSSLIPEIDLGLRSGISRPKPDFVGGENTQLSLGASYELDLWGRIRYGIHAQQYRIEATRFDYYSAAISLSAETSLTWFRLNTALEQLRLVDQQLATNEQTLKLIRARFSSGQVRGVDILRQQQLISSTKEQKILLETDIEIFKNQLSTLLGKVPGNLPIDTIKGTVPRLPPLPATGVPLDLVNRRPDVQSAYYQLQASDREVASAISAKYPRLSLSMTAAIRSNDINDLLQSQALSLSGALLAPLFYGGRLTAAVDEAKAIREQQINNYSQAVLLSFQEVENVLIRERKQKERIERIEEQVNLAERSNQQLEIEYLNGLSEYLDVLTGLNQEQQLQRDLINAKLSLIEIRVALYRAIAGGFETERENEKGLNQ